MNINIIERKWQKSENSSSQNNRISTTVSCFTFFSQKYLNLKFRAMSDVELLYVVLLLPAKSYENIIKQ